MQVQANCAVCKADDSGAMCLSASPSCKDLFGTHSIGMHGKIRSWKSVSHLFLFIFIIPYSQVFVGFYEFAGINVHDFACVCLVLRIILLWLIFEGSSPSNVGEANGLRLIPQSMDIVLSFFRQSLCQFSYPCD